MDTVCFCLLATVNKAVVKQVSVPVPVFNSFEYIPSSGIAGSDSNSVCKYFLPICHLSFYSLNSVFMFLNFNEVQLTSFFSHE